MFFNSHIEGINYGNFFGNLLPLRYSVYFSTVTCNNSLHSPKDITPGSASLLFCLYVCIYRDRSANLQLYAGINVIYREASQMGN